MLEAVVCEKECLLMTLHSKKRSPPVVIVVAVIFTVVLVAIHRHCRCQIVHTLEFVIVHHPLPLPLPGSDEVRELFDPLLPPHVVPAANPPGGRVCNIVVHRITVILASFASPAAASAASAAMLRGHLPPQVVMTATMLTPSPLNNGTGGEGGGDVCGI
jgi:hypothetical protein